MQGELAIDLVLAGQTNSVTCNFSGFARAERHPASCVGDGMLQLWCTAGGVKHEDCV
jgi:hypothetical protein